MKKNIALSAFLLGGLCVFAQQKNDSIKKENEIEEIELFGEVNKQPQDLEVITRLPLKPRDQIQSISVISYKAIEQLGGLTITDVAKNIPGVIQFGSYGGTRESMSIRGFRGVPVLKNGVMMDSDFRTGALITDMQGVESIQIIKGSAAITQGIGDGLGAAGGVINVVTKIPKFVDATNIGFRYGSWDFYRPTVDFQRVLDSKGKVAVRFNAAYQNSNSFRSHVDTERIYVNPSIALRPDDKTEVVVEFDYMHNNTVPDRGTVNLAGGDTNALYEMPKGKFLGYATDYAKTETFNFATTAVRKLTDKLKLRAAYINASYTFDLEGATLGNGAAATGYAIRPRFMAKSARKDNNQVFQFDFIGENVNTGFIKHTFQVGFDWKQSNVTTTSYTATKADGTVLSSTRPLDYIDVLNGISNTLPEAVFYTAGDPVNVTSPTYGLMAQDVLTFNKYVKAHLGVRYSSLVGAADDIEHKAWNPSFGLMLFPVENINVFGSFTTTTSLRGANNPLEGGGIVGASKTTQWETGIKSDWFNQRLRFNVTLFDIKNDNLSYSILDTGGNATGLYGLAGNLRRKGVEVEVIGRIMRNLQVMAGWAYLDAKYHDSPAFVENSSPMNAAKNTANAWVNYRFDEGFLTGFDIGAGIYHVGSRPVDDYTQKTFHNGHELAVTPGTKPFLMKAYTTVEAQAGYTFTNGLGLRIFFNNIFDTIGYSSYYRGGYLDQIQPRNLSAQINYRF